MNNIGFKNWAELNSAHISVIKTQLFQLANYKIEDFKKGLNGWERNWIKFKDKTELTLNRSSKTIYGFDRIGLIVAYGKYLEYPSPEVQRLPYDKIDRDELALIYQNAYNSVFPLPMKSYSVGQNYYTQTDSLLSFNVATLKNVSRTEGSENDLEKQLIKAIYENYLMKQVCVFIQL